VYEKCVTAIVEFYEESISPPSFLGADGEIQFYSAAEPRKQGAPCRCYHDRSMQAPPGWVAEMNSQEVAEKPSLSFGELHESDSTCLPKLIGASYLFVGSCGLLTIQPDISSL
jgi:hypothetical protein